MLEPTDIKKLFALLQARYGHKWTTAYDDPDIMAIAVSEWHRELKGFRQIDLRNGLTAWRDPWPPTLPEFVDACMPDLMALGYDVDSEISKRLPGYYYIPDSAREIRRRQETADKISADVMRRLTNDALLQIQERGVEALIEHGATDLIDHDATVALKDWGVS